MVQDVSPSTTLRLALVTGGLNLGGTTTFLCNLAGELVRRNIAVKVFSFEKENPLASDFHDLNIPVFCTDNQSSIFEDRMQCILLELKKFKPTIVVANLGPASFETLRYVPTGVFRVGTVQSDDPNVYSRLAHYVPAMDLLAVVSQVIKTKVEKMPELSRVPVRYLPYGVPMPAASLLAPRVIPPALRILYLGRIAQEQKRVRLFPEILENLKSFGIPFSWTIAGEGPDKIYLEQVMKSNHPSQIISFPGKIAYADVPRLLRDHDVFLLTSDYEGLPLSLLEAMGQGLVPIVSDLPSGIGELVDETNGIRISPDDVSGYGNAIVALHHARNRLRELSEKARLKVHLNYSVSAMADRWLAAFPNNAAIDPWPQECRLKPILGAKNPIYFSPLFRSLRRFLIRFHRSH